MLLMALRADSCGFHTLPKELLWTVFRFVCLPPSLDEMSRSPREVAPGHDPHADGAL